MAVTSVSFNIECECCTREIGWYPDSVSIEQGALVIKSKQFADDSGWTIQDEGILCDHCAANHNEEQS